MGTEPITPTNTWTAWHLKSGRVYYKGGRETAAVTPLVVQG